MGEQAKNDIAPSKLCGLPGRCASREAPALVLLEAVQLSPTNCREPSVLVLTHVLFPRVREARVQLPIQLFGLSVSLQNRMRNRQHLI